MAEPNTGLPPVPAFQGELDAYRELCAIIARATMGPHSASLVPALEAARNAHVAAVAADVAARCVIERAVSEEREWACWLGATTEWLTRFRTVHAAAIAAYTPARASADGLKVTVVRRTVELASQARWEEALDGILALARASGVPVSAAARLTAIAGQIEQWRYQQMDRAQELLEQAEALAPEDGWLAAAVGDCWQQLGDGARAREYYERARRLAPTDSCGFVSEGELHESRSAWDEAEQWFRRAMEVAPGEALGIDRLMRVLARPDVFASNRERLLELLAHRNAIEPDGAYDAFLAMGDYSQAADRGDETGAWFRRACELEPRWPRAWLRLAEWEGERGQTAEAERLVRHAIQVAPEYGDAHLALGIQLEAQERWAEAVEVYRAITTGSRTVMLYARALEGRVLYSMGDRAAAEACLTSELRTNPHSEPARIEMENLFRKSWEQWEDPEAAARILGLTRELCGPSYEATYRNLLGNMHYARDEFAASVAEYQQAIAAQPRDPVFQRNLSNALAFTGDYDGALAALDAAHAIDGEDVRREEGRASIANRRGNAAWNADEYEEAVEAYALATTLNAREPVYWSNLAGALERLESGDRLASLTRAIDALERSASISGTTELAPRIERVRTKRDVLECFGKAALDRLPLVTPIAVDLANDLVPLAEASGEGLQARLGAEVLALRERIQAEFGVTLPGVRFRGNEVALADGQYLTSFHNVPVALGAVPLDQRFVAEHAESLTSRGISANPATDPVTGEGGAWVSRGDAETHDLEAWTPERFLIREVEAVLRRGLAEFVGHKEVLELLDGDASAAARVVRDSPALLSRLTAVARAMLMEGVGMDPIGAMADVVASPELASAAPHDLVEAVRMHAANRTPLRGIDGAKGFVVVGKPLEEALRASMRTVDGERLLAMEPEACQAALAAAREAFAGAAPTVVVEDHTLRPFVRRLLDVEWPQAAVVAARELPGTRSLNAAARMTFDDAREPEAVDVPLPLHELPAVPPAAERWPRVTLSMAPAMLTWQSPADESPLAEQLSGLQDAIHHELGLLVPDIVVEPDPTLGMGDSRVRLGDHVRVLTTFRADDVFINAAMDEPGIEDPQARYIANPVNDAPACLATFSPALQERCARHGHTMWGPHGYMVLQLADAIRMHAHELHTRTATVFALNTLGGFAPDTVRLAIDRYGIDVIDGVLRGLVRERIPIRDLCGILEGLLSITGVVTVELGRYIVFTAAADGLCLASTGRTVSTLDAAELVEYVRAFLRRQVTHVHARRSSTLPVYLLDPEIEHLVSHGGADEAKRAEIIAAVRAEVEAQAPGYAAHVLTTPEARPHVAELLRTPCPRVPVLSYAELTPDLNIQAISRISLS